MPISNLENCKLMVYTYDDQHEDNDKYEWTGRCVNGLTEGRGVLKHYRISDTYGYEYKGEMRAGRMDGQGVQTFNSGDKYEGKFKVGGVELGTQFFPSGPNQIHPTGPRFVGTFKRGNYCVKGTVYDFGKKFSGTCGEFGELPENYRAYSSMKQRERYEQEMAAKKREETEERRRQSNQSQQRQSGRGGVRELIEIDSGYTLYCNDGFQGGIVPFGDGLWHQAFWSRTDSNDSYYSKSPSQVAAHIWRPFIILCNCH